MVTKTVHGLRILQSELLLALGLPHGWFDASLGNTSFRADNPYDDPEWIDEHAMHARRATACETLGLDGSRLVVTSGLLQTDIVQVIDASFAGAVAGPADGYVTAEGGMPVLLAAADCAQIIIFDPERRVLGVVHSGGLGTSRRIVERAIARMRTEYSADPARMVVAIGPTLSGRHFVPTVEIDGFTLDDIKAGEPVTVLLPDGRVGYDIAATLTKQLVAAGIDRSRIEVSDIDTFETKRFYSWERDRRTDTAASMRRNGLIVALS